MDGRKPFILDIDTTYDAFGVNQAVVRRQALFLPGLISIMQETLGGNLCDTQVNQDFVGCSVHAVYIDLCLRSSRAMQ